MHFSRKIDGLLKIVVLTTLVMMAGTTTALAVPADQLPNGTWAGIKWTHTNVSGWSKTATMSSASAGSGGISFPFDKAGSWPGRTVYGTPGLNGNVWAIINHGGWYAIPFDFLRIGQQTKLGVAIHHATVEESALSSWHPHDGEEMYIFVSGLARSADRNVSERSNVVRVYWNQGTSTPGPSCTAPPTIDDFSVSGSHVIKAGEKVRVTWKVTGASSVALYASEDGKFQKVLSGGSEAAGSGYLSPSKTTTYVLRATNECVKDGAYPEKQLTIMVGGGIPGVSILLLEKGAKK